MSDKNENKKLAGLLLIHWHDLIIWDDDSHFNHRVRIICASCGQHVDEDANPNFASAKGRMLLLEAMKRLPYYHEFINELFNYETPAYVIDNYILGQCGQLRSFAIKFLEERA